MKRIVPDSIKKILGPLDRSRSNNIHKSNKKHKSNPSIRHTLPPPIKNNSKISIFPPWGIDRLNQNSLPLDKQYTSDFTGDNLLRIILTLLLSLFILLLSSFMLKSAHQVIKRVNFYFAFILYFNVYMCSIF